MLADVSAPYHARTRYAGDTARRYVSRRAGTAKWRREQAALEALIAELPRGSLVLDVPLGTARFARAYARGAHRVIGLDVSADMLAEARAASRASGSDLHYVRGDAESLPLADGAVDWVVCTRFLNWLPPATMAAVLTELLRVAHRGALVQVRVRRPLAAGELVRRVVERRRWRRLRGLLRRARALLGRLRGADAGYVLHHPDAVGQVAAAAGVPVAETFTLGRWLALLRRESQELRVYRLCRPAGGGR